MQGLPAVQLVAEASVCGIQRGDNSSTDSYNFDLPTRHNAPRIANAATDAAAVHPGCKSRGNLDTSAPVRNCSVSIIRGNREE